jgi:hypothetical protein
LNCHHVARRFPTAIAFKVSFAEEKFLHDALVPREGLGAQCFPGTRRGILNEVEKWLEDDHQLNILCDSWQPRRPKDNDLVDSRCSA